MIRKLFALATVFAVLGIAAPAQAQSPLIRQYDCYRMHRDGTLPAAVPHPESYLVRGYQGKNRLRVLDVDELTSGLGVTLKYACKLGVPGVGN